MKNTNTSGQPPTLRCDHMIIWFKLNIFKETKENSKSFVQLDFVTVSESVHTGEYTLCVLCLSSI